MNNDELVQQIRNAVKEEIKAETEPIKKQLKQQGTDINHLSTAVEALSTKGDVETAVSTAKEEIQADLLNLGARINRTLHNQETRIKNLEKHTGTTDPTKN